MYMVMHFSVGVLAVLGAYPSTPAPGAFIISWLSLGLDFDSACSIIDAAINGTTMWKDPKYGNWHSVSRCDDWFLGHAQLTHTLVFAVVSAVLLVIPTKLLLQRSIAVSGKTCFNMLLLINSIHLLLDLVTYAKDCNEREHLYLWPLSEQSWHMNCIIHEIFSVQSISPCMRTLRIASEAIVHCWVWRYLWSARISGDVLTRTTVQWIAIAALPGYLLEEIGPAILGVPNGWGNVLFFVWIFCVSSRYNRRCSC